MFISHVGQDTGTSLAGWLKRELTANGLDAFLDHSNGPQAGDAWPDVLKQAASSCRVFVVLLSPSFFLREWPVRELRIALARLQTDASAVTVIPVYCGWTRQQASAALKRAARSSDGSLRFQHAQTGQVTEGPVWQPPADQSSLQPASQACAQLQMLMRVQQQLSKLQPPNAPRIFHEHYKLIEVEVVEEIVCAALRVLPRIDFEVPAGKPASLACCLWAPGLGVLMQCCRPQTWSLQYAS